jgi:superoxide reductase
MNRRKFMRLGLAGGIAGAVLPQQLRAEEDCALMAGGVYYTQGQPGRWEKKVGSHLPKLEKIGGAGGVVVVKVTTDHPQQGYKHYIIKHQLLDAGYRFLDEKMFDPEQDEPVSEFALPAGYKGMVYALSMCNKHDLWLHGMEI